jgi:hypothetical protein
MSSSGSSGGVFLFDTPQAVMHVLASVRKSDITANDKNSLRDLILSYTNGGKDPSLKIQIEQKLASLAVNPLSQTAITTTPTPEFGSSRGVPVTFTAAAPVAQITPIAVIPASQTTSIAPAAPVAQPEPAPVSPVQMTPVVVPVLPQVVPVLPVVSTPTPAPVAVAPQPNPALSTDNSTALARVREIKSIVNDKIGNPVNLVDIDNKVGREYMSALLDAMKKLSSGINSASTMDRLEAAFVDVKRVLEQPRAAEQVAPVIHTSVAPAPQSIPIVPVPKSVPVVTSVPKSVPVVTSVPKSVPVVTSVPTPSVPVEPTPKPINLKPESLVPTPTESKLAPLEPKLATKPVEEPTPTPAPVTTPIEDRRWEDAVSSVKPAPIKPLSESAEPLKSISDVPTQDSLTNKDADPLQSQEVNEGLDQLLADWMLFKKSGLFGTGPNGSLHPLYLKIKELQIPLLLAGRFEGATQDIKQSITDYMNGWRYEQGIIYEQGETFDHYLRRVIRHILDLQK